MNKERGMSLQRLIGIMILMLVSAASFAQERDVALLAAACAACHGTNGHSVAGTPSLAGLDKLYFIEQMQQFRSGERSATVMMQHVSGYTEEEVRLLADYFSTQ
jgi:cytochrome c553